MNLSPKIYKLPKITKSCNMYVILKLLFNKNWFLVITEENSQSFWSNLCSILLTRQFGGANFSKDSQVCHIKVYGSNYLRKHWQKNHFFFQKKTWWSYHHHGMNYEKHVNHTMIMPWIMTTMPRKITAMPS